MKTKILAFAGTKQSGKSTACNFIHGYQMRCYGIVDDFAVLDDGSLVVDTTIIDEKGQEQQGAATLDIDRVDMEFAEWAIYSMWPYVKKYSFASALKAISVSLFGLKDDQVYGTDGQKNQIVPHLRWENMPGVITDTKLWTKICGKNKNVDGLVFHKKGPMTARQFLQYMGTDVMRRIYEPIWVNACLEDIRREEPLLAVIDDCRFQNEIEAVQSEGGKVIGLSRSPYKDSHKSEQALKDNWESVDDVIDNSKMKINEVNKEIIQLLDSWGWLGSTIKSEEMPFKEKETESQGGIHTIKKAATK